MFPAQHHKRFPRNPHAKRCRRRAAYVRSALPNGRAVVGHASYDVGIGRLRYSDARGWWCHF